MLAVGIPGARAVPGAVRLVSRRVLLVFGMPPPEVEGDWTVGGAWLLGCSCSSFPTCQHPAHQWSVPLGNRYHGDVSLLDSMCCTPMVGWIRLRSVPTCPQQAFIQPLVGIQNYRLPESVSSLEKHVS